MDEWLFADAMASAFIRASEFRDSAVLVGAQPDHAKIEYGWIELGEPVGQQGELFGVQAFREKPSLEIARKLLLNPDSVWNTLVMVGRVKVFLEMFHAALPVLSTSLAPAALWKDGGDTYRARHL